MCHRSMLFAVFVAVGLLATSDTLHAAGHYKLAWIRERGAWETGNRVACEGTYVLDVLVFDEFGQRRSGVQVRLTDGTLLGTTDADGMIHPLIHPENQVEGSPLSIKCVDGSGSGSDTASGITTRYNPCWGRHAWEVAFLYKTSASNPGSFDVNWKCSPHTACGDQASCANQNQAPYTNSLGYHGINCTDAQSDTGTLGNYGGPYGQTFVATANRVIAVRTLGTFAGPSAPFAFNFQILTWPGKVPVGPVKSTGMYWPFGVTTPCSVNDYPVIPGQTYMVRFWRDEGMTVYRVGNVYGQGQFYEGDTPMPGHDMVGYVAFMDYGITITSGPSAAILQPTYATIQWTTDVPSDSKVEYGLTTAYGQQVTDAALITNHSITLTNLTPGGTYHFRVRSAATNYTPAQSENRTFTLPLTATGILAGQTRTSAGVLLDEVEVRAEPGGRVTRSEQGNYAISNLTAGTYTVTAWRPGYCQFSQSAVQVSGNATATLNLWLTSTAANAVSNPGFDASLAGWTTFGGGLSYDPTGAWSIDAHNGAGYAGKIMSWSGANTEGGAYQVVGGLQAGQAFEAAVYLYTDSWRTNPNNSFPSNIQARIGVDLGAGTNPASANIVWSAYATSFRKWSYIHLPFTPTGTSATLFLQYRITDTQEWNKLAFDDVVIARVSCPVTAVYVTQGPSAIDVTDTTATIAWLTSVPSDSRVEYGLTTGYGQWQTDSASVLAHSVVLTGLKPNQTYHLRVSSQAPGYTTAVSGNATFTTQPGPPTSRADFDLDFDVDQADFGHLQQCLSGPGFAQTAPACLNARLDADDDVDQDDVLIFIGCMSGAGVPAAIDCGKLN